MYNHHYTHSDTQDNTRLPTQDTTNDQYDEWLRRNYDLFSYPGSGGPEHFDAPLQTIPAPEPTMYTPQTGSQMLHPMWQHYNSSFAASQEYNYHHSQYQYPGYSDMAAGPIPPSLSLLYDPASTPQEYRQSFPPIAPTNRTFALLPFPAATHPPSPAPCSPRSHPPSPQPQVASPIDSPSSNNSMFSGNLYPQITPAPSSPPHIPHILPHPQPTQRRQRVPQTLEAGHSNSKVEFRVNGVLGIRVQDAVRNFVEIDAGEDRVLARIGARTIRLAIHWPGAQPVGSYVTVKDDGQPVTRTQFANRVSVAIARMLTKVAKTQHANARFLLGTNGINTNNLWIQYVIPASQNMWIAELEAENTNS